MDDLDVRIACERFDLRRWCAQHRFVPQGRRAEEHLHDCPFCGAEDKFSINVVTRKYRCFVCKRPVTMLDVLAKFEGSYQRAVQVVLAGAEQRKGSLAFIPELDDAVVAKKQRPRGWQPAPIDPPSHFVPLEGHTSYTFRRGLCLESMLAIGAGYCTWGRYQDRLVFPVRRVDGAWLYYQGRAMWEKHEDPTPDYYRKNLNPETDETHASASEVLLGLDLVVRGRTKRVALVEGPTDWTQVGPGALATFGKTLSDEQMRLLVEVGVEEVDVMHDPDAWEPPTTRDPDGTVRFLDKPPPAQVTCEKLASLFAVRVVRFPVGYDAGDYSPADNARWRAAAPRFGNGSRLLAID